MVGVPRAGDLGRAILWPYRTVLARPSDPLAGPAVPWHWWRAYGVLLLDSAVWGFFGGAAGAAARAVRRRRAAQ